MKKFVFIFLLFFVKNIYSQNLKIGILNNLELDNFKVELLRGSYEVFADGKMIFEMRKNLQLSAKIYESKIILYTKYKILGKFDTIYIKKKQNILRKLLFLKNFLKISLKNNFIKNRTYDDNLIFYLKNNKFVLINEVGFTNYIAGVVESESGSKCEFEYYKAQVILCQTYLMRNKNKHKKDGFNMCDGVHCQSYKGKNLNNKKIYKASRKFKKYFVIDKKNKFIDAVFYANCGGETCRAEDVWSNKISYLKPVKDTFCIHTKQAKWNKIISFKDWKNFLFEKVIPINDSIDKEKLNFKQKDSLLFSYFLPKKYPANSIELLNEKQKDSLLFENSFFEQKNRKKDFEFFEEKIKLTKIRYFFKLRSTFFEIKNIENYLYFQGRGYGHGVGFCQEGAMEMAKKGFNYKEIIKFYYKDVNLKKNRNIEFKN